MWSWLKSWIPVSRSRYLHDLEQSNRLFQTQKEQHLNELKSIRAIYENSLNAQAKAVDKIVERACKIDFSRLTGGVYMISLSFNARLFEGLYHEEELRCLAKRVAGQVEAEIASSRFVQSARDAH